MKVLQIGNVAERKNHAGDITQYATSAAGVALFGNKNLKLVKGHFAIVEETFQTMGYVEGVLKPLDTPKAITRILSVWATKAEALQAKNEDAFTEIEEDIMLAEARAKAKTFSVADAVKNAAAIVE